MGIHRVGESIRFSGYVDDFDHNVSAIEFSLDDGAHWTTYETPGVQQERGVSWEFAYTPQLPGIYHLKVRAVDGRGNAAYLVAEIPFQVVGKDEPVCEQDTGVLPKNTMRLRALGGIPLERASIFRSRELAQATSEDALLIADLGIRTIYDIRTQHEIAARPDPRISEIYTVALEPSEWRRKNADKRLIAGVIGEYGEPEQRMRANYRRYVQEYPLIGTALRSMAQKGTPALVHCVNGKDRTGVICAVIQLLAGVHMDDILADYVAYNQLNADLIQAEADRLGVGMTAAERAILMSFLEARPAYLQAFFDEVDNCFGTFDAYAAESLRITSAQQDSLMRLAAERPLL